MNLYVERPSSVLIIDDERVERVLVSRSIAKAGFSCTEATDVASATEIIRNSPPFDFVVLDLQLGDSDGLQILHVLSENLSSTVLILISGFDERIRTASSRLAVQLGLRVGGTLRKPIVPAHLLEILKNSQNRLFLNEIIDSNLAVREEDLRVAIESKQIVAEYQPKLSMHTGKMVGVEALARWYAPTGNIPPNIFIPVAERTGLIKPLTASILDQALQAYKGWKTHNPECTVAVNISPTLLNDPGLPDQIDQALRSHNLSPGCLVLEITESAAFSNVIIATEILTRLRIRGVGLSIDDFGTGHASLLSLLNMPFSELKIDRAFVAMCHKQSDARKIVRAAISLARELGLKVVAEGVEVPEMLEVLKEANCDVGQGWLFGKPMSAPLLTDLLKK